HAIEIDGHEVGAIDQAYGEAAAADRPVAIVARTIKGKGVKAVEDKPGWHGKALDNADAAIEELGGIRNITVQVARPERSGRTIEIERGRPELPRYDVGDEVATRKAYGEALAALGKARGDVRSRRNRLPADAPAEHSGHLRGRRRVRDRRLADGPRRRRRRSRRRGRNRARGAQGRGSARRGGDRGSSDRPLLDQAARRGDDPRAGRADRHRRGSLRRGWPRRGRAVGARRLGR